MTTAKANSRPRTSARAWPLEVTRFRRRDRLSQAESDALQGLGFDLLRLDRDRDTPTMAGDSAADRAAGRDAGGSALVSRHRVSAAVRPLRHRDRAAPLRRAGQRLLVVVDPRVGRSAAPAAAAAAIRGAGRHAGSSLSARPCLSAGRVHRLRPGRAVRATYIGAESIRGRPRRGGDRTRSRGAGWLGIPRRESGVDDLHVTAAQPQPDADRPDLTGAGQPALGSERSSGISTAATCTAFTGPWPHSVTPVRHRHRDTGTGPSLSPAPPRAGRTRSNAGTPPRRSNPAPATPTASFWPRSADGWRPNTPTSPGLPTGPARPARPGSPQSTACASATTSNRRTGGTAAAISWESRCRRRRNAPTFASPAPSSATSRTGTGSRAGSTPHEHWKLRAASGPCRDPIRG